jgi:aldehyde:ferredoxin oxidoreductase
MNGGPPSYGGKILRVNLSTGKISSEPTAKYAVNFLGGRGINARILFDESNTIVGCFDPENPLIYGVGTLVGTLAPFACRVSIETKNAFTGGLGSANCGGHFGAEMKFAGFDNAVITGRAERPVYLWMEDGDAELRDASPLRGMTTWDTERWIREEQGDNEVRVSCIGPAGENLVRSACIMTDRAKAAGGSGVGAVMGSKNLKALAARGHRSVEIADPERFMDAVDEALRVVEGFPKARRYREEGYYGVESYFGSPAWEVGFRPVRNGQDDYWDPEKIGRVSGDALKRYREKILACFGCPVGCMPWMRVEDGPYRVEGEGWWNNSSNSFCTRVDCDDPEAALKAHLLANQLGLDGDNASVAIAWAFECYERGLITAEDSGGLELDWGNHDAVLTLLEMLANREGLGDLLAEGVMRAAEKIGRGSLDFALHIKGQDTVDGIRVSKGWGFGVVTSPAAGRHLRGALHTFEPDEFLSYEGVPWRVFMQEQFKAILDMTGVCLYNNGLLSWETRIHEDAAKLITELTSAATGLDLSTAKFMRMGRQVHNLEKAFNSLHGGFTRRDDYPPTRYWNEPVKSGPYRGERIDHERWEEMLDEYYALHGWDRETGLQTREALEDLGLRTIANGLEKAGRLAG